MSSQYTRREFLHRALLGGVGLAGLMLAACGSGSSATAPSASTSSATAGSGPVPTATQQSMSGTAMPGMNMATSASVAPAATPVNSPTAAAIQTTSTSATTTTESATPAQVAISIVEPSIDYTTWTYKPNDVKVPLGTVVVWTNTGGAAHTVTSDDGKSFDSGSIPPGKTFTHTMDTSGTFPYHCTYHPFMKGTITVTG